jgi:hypothetical protein
MDSSSLLHLLNRLLEAERAGAKVLVAYLEEYEPASEAAVKLLAVQRDEARNCAILMGWIRELGGTPSTATGDFLGKALAVNGRSERLAFLNRGQAWVARKIAEVLPDLPPGPLKAALAEMETSHVENIAACDRLLA